MLLYVTNPHAPPWRSGRSLAATFPLPVRVELGHGVHEVEIVRERDGGYVASLDGGEHRFEIDELGGDTIRFRSDGVMESARFLRDGDRLYILHRGVTHCGPRSDAGGAGLGGGQPAATARCARR